MSYFVQNLIAAFAGVLSAAALSFIKLFPKWRVLAVVMVIWFAALAAAERYTRSFLKDRQSILPVLFFTSFSFVGLIGLIEWRVLHWILIALACIIVFFLFHFSFVFGASFAARKNRPRRRALMILWAFDAYALSSTMFAISVFFPSVPFWVIAVFSGLLFSYISYMIWNMYFSINIRKNWLWLFMILFVMIELVWVTRLLPYGYLVNGFLVTWIWYIMQLLMRFHFGRKGVVWKEQMWFLIGNAVLYVLFLAFFVRWI